jgi:uncharacterized protein with HEPN domain
MSMRDDRVSLRDMLNHASEAVELLGDGSRDEFGKNRVMQLAVTRLVEVVGEAASRVSVATRHRYSDIPWPQIIGMRNRLIHGYDVVDWDLLWDTVQSDLPPLIASLRKASELQ